MKIKSYSEFINLYEWHESGAAAPEETLSRFIDNMLRLGLDKDGIKYWIRKIIDTKDLYSIMKDVRKNMDRSLSPLRQPKEIQIINYLYDGISTVLDDGYLMDDVYKSLEKIYNYL